MTTYSLSGYFGYAGGGKNGATVDLWATSRFTGFPPENEAPPSGSPDAGPVTTSDAFGGPGAYLITGIPTVQDYYVRIQYGGNTYWGERSAASLGGGVVIGAQVAYNPVTSVFTTQPAATNTFYQADTTSGTAPVITLPSDGGLYRVEMIAETWQSAASALVSVGLGTSIASLIALREHTFPNSSVVAFGPLVAPHVTGTGQTIHPYVSTAGGTGSGFTMSIYGASNGPCSLAAYRVG